MPAYLHYADARRGWPGRAETERHSEGVDEVSSDHSIRTKVLAPGTLRSRGGAQSFPGTNGEQGRSRRATLGELFERQASRQEPTQQSRQRPVRSAHLVPDPRGRSRMPWSSGRRDSPAGSRPLPGQSGRQTLRRNSSRARGDCGRRPSDSDARGSGTGDGAPAGCAGASYCPTAPRNGVMNIRLLTHVGLSLATVVRRAHLGYVRCAAQGCGVRRLGSRKCGERRDGPRGMIAR
jgi:hypothetical protein